MRGRCADCAEKLSLARRILGKRRCPVCEAAFVKEIAKARTEAEALKTEHRNEYKEVLDQIIPGVDLNVIGRRVAAAKRATKLSAGEIASLDCDKFSHILRLVAEDKVLDPTEDQWMNQVLTMLDYEPSQEQWHDYMILALKSGLVLRDSNPPDMLVRPGEVNHFHCLAARQQLTPQQELEWSGAEIDSGMSGKAVGGALSKGRAKIVTTGTQVERTDTGQLVVTSERVLFLGNRQTVEVELGNLVGVKVSSPTIRLQVSNGQDSPVFEVSSTGADFLATLILTSAKRKAGTLANPAPSKFPQRELPPMPKLLVKSGFKD